MEVGIFPGSIFPPVVRIHMQRAHKCDTHTQHLGNVRRQIYLFIWMYSLWNISRNNRENEYFGIEGRLKEILKHIR